LLGAPRVPNPARRGPTQPPAAQVVVPALARLPVFGAALGLQQGALDATKRGVPASAFVEDSDPDCVARCGARAQAPAAALSAGGR
jgi:hypothetical protein